MPPSPGWYYQIVESLQPSVSTYSAITQCKIQHTLESLHKNKNIGGSYSLSGNLHVQMAPINRLTGRASPAMLHANAPCGLSSEGSILFCCRAHQGLKALSENKKKLVINACGDMILSIRLRN